MLSLTIETIDIYPWLHRYHSDLLRFTLLSCIPFTIDIDSRLKVKKLQVFLTIYKYRMATRILKWFTTLQHTDFITITPGTSFSFLSRPTYYRYRCRLSRIIKATVNVNIFLLSIRIAWYQYTFESCKYVGIPLLSLSIDNKLDCCHWLLFPFKYIQ